jgi:mono/diheme cytochrome c family protein
MKTLILIALAVTTSVAAVSANRSPASVTVSVRQTPPGSGKQMYASYCAPCHGVYGRGDGPVAVQLSQRPADLSALSRNNGGKFPSEHVMAVLQFGAAKPRHGAAEMPVWGPILAEMDGGYAGQTREMVRIVSLTHYLESIQVK